MKIFGKSRAGALKNGAAIGDHNSVSVSRHEETADDRRGGGKPEPEHLGPEERG